MKKIKITGNKHPPLLSACRRRFGLFRQRQKRLSATKAETIAKSDKAEKIMEENYSQKVIPEDGVVLPVRWGDLGAKMTSVGVIDKTQFEEMYAGRGGLSEGERKLLEGLDNGYFKITPENSGFVLNLLWALGLGNKNEILDNGPMTDKKYGGAGRFASTGGWTLAEGDSMDHYSKHRFIVLTPEQQALVEKVSKGIYRPCCGNSVYFPIAITAWRCWDSLN